MWPLTQDRRQREVRHYAYVDRDFGQVRSYLTAAPQGLLRDHSLTRDAGGGLLTGLHLHRAGLDVSRDVRVVIGDLQLSARSVRAPLHWEDARRPGLFPVLDATLEIIPVASGRRHTTQIGFVGRYEAPLGWFGAVGDWLAGNRLVIESVEEFVEGLAGRLERELPEAPPVAREAERHPEGPPSRLRRVFLPIEDLRPSTRRSHRGCEASGDRTGGRHGQDRAALGNRRRGVRRHRVRALPPPRAARTRLG